MVESDFKALLPIVFAISLGAVVLLIVYLLFSFRRKTEVQQKPKNKNLNAKDDKSSAHSEKKKEIVQSGKAKKKIVDKRWRTDLENYSHPWLLTTFKGHTGNILDIDFSSNGKYLVSCGDEDPDPGGATTESSSSSSESTKDSNLPLSTQNSPNTKGLSRRQRKNRKREDVVSLENSKLKKQKPKKMSESRKQTMAVVPLRQFFKFNSSERVFYGLLHNYLLSHVEMMRMSYPVRYKEHTSAVIFKWPRTFSFNVNARAFVPKNEQVDSGQGSGNSSDSGENCDADSTTSSSSSSSSEQDAQTYYDENQVSPPPPRGDYYIRTCCRCSRIFYTTDDKYITKEKCVHHWGKLQTVNSFGNEKNAQVIYTCCRGKPRSRGCTEGQLHVWNGLSNGLNGPYEDFVFTKPKKTPPPDGNYGVYAIDCEMSYTVRGLELTKVTVVGMDGRLVYDSFVKPDCEIVDYNTRFSGVSAKDLKKGYTKNVREVQNDLMGFINANTILIGHGLENDLKALKIVHYCVVDTVHTFPHYNGLPYRRSLKNLTSSILKREIQTGRHGHNSYEDASACMELMLWKSRKEFKSFLIHH